MSAIVGNVVIDVIVAVRGGTEPLTLASSHIPLEFGLAQYNDGVAREIAVDVKHRDLKPHIIEVLQDAVTSLQGTETPDTETPSAAQPMVSSTKHEIDVLAEELWETRRVLAISWGKGSGWSSKFDEVEPWVRRSYLADARRVWMRLHPEGSERFDTAPTDTRIELLAARLYGERVGDLSGHRWKHQNSSMKSAWRNRALGLLRELTGAEPVEPTSHVDEVVALLRSTASVYPVEQLRRIIDTLPSIAIDGELPDLAQELRNVANAMHPLRLSRATVELVARELFKVGDSSRVEQTHENPLQWEQLSEAVQSLWYARAESVLAKL